MATDCTAFAAWVEAALVPLAAEKCLPGVETDPAKHPVMRALASQVAALRATAAAVWAQVCVRVAESCKFPALNSVRTIAGKFRMTNKPTPDRPSAFIKTLLAPLDEHSRTFEARALATGLCAPGWGQVVVDAVADELLLQTHQLLDTARQMDSSLQRRSMMSNKVHNPSFSAVRLALPCPVPPRSAMHCISPPFLQTTADFANSHRPFNYTP